MNKSRGCANDPGPRSRYVALHLRRDMTCRRDDGGLINARQNAIIGVGRQGIQCRLIESLDDEPDAKRQLPNELWDDHEAPQHRHWLEDPEQYADETSDEHRAGDEPQQGHAPWHEGGRVHQVAQNQPVADAYKEAGPKQERPIFERDQRLTGGEERAGIRARSLLPQRHDRKDAEDADGDEDAFNDTSRDIAESEDFVNPLEDGEQHNGGADVRDDEEQLQERSREHAVVGAATDDVARVVQHRDVVINKWGDRGGKRDQEQYARNSCDRLRIHLDSFLSEGQRQATTNRRGGFAHARTASRSCQSATSSPPLDQEGHPTCWVNREAGAPRRRPPPAKLRRA